MARYKDAKCRLCRKEGAKLFLKGTRCFSPKCPIERRGGVPPGQHGQKGGKRLSEYGLQLREKQKVKRLYGVLERQFRRYYREAAKVKEATGRALLQLLERRLDNVVYRLGFVPSRGVARQLVNHGHVLVDGKKVNIPSYRVKPEETISLDAKALNISEVKKALMEKDKVVPKWLKRKAAVGKIVSLPEREEIESDINEQLIVEFYSR